MLLLTEAQNLSLPNLQRGIIETIVTSDQFFQLVPFKPTGGRYYEYEREDTISEGDFIDVGEDVNEGTAMFADKVQKLKTLIGDADVPNFIDETMSDENAQAAIQIAKKGKGLARKYANRVINGNETTNPKEFNGLVALAAQTPAQVLDYDNSSFDFEALDWMIDNNKVDGLKMFVFNGRTRRSFARISRGLGGTTPEMLNMEGVTGPMMAYRGIPILKNDWIPINQTNTSTGNNACTSIFLVTLDEVEGFCGLASRKGLGIRVTNLGELEKKDVTRYRCKWYCAAVLHNPLALSAVIGIND